MPLSDSCPVDTFGICWPRVSDFYETFLGEKQHGGSASMSPECTQHTSCVPNLLPKPDSKTRSFSGSCRNKTPLSGMAP